MTKRSGAVSIACGLGIGAALVGVGVPHSAARAQSADLVLCDRVAAAIKFCKAASAASRRALYQLGRAYAANQQLPDALAAYRRAADKGSTSAMVELGVLL